MSLIETAAKRLLLPKKETLIQKLRANKIGERTIQAFQAVDRYDFTPPFFKHQAYEDKAISLGRRGSTLSQPYVVALMTDLLDPQEGNKVLEVGTATGYQAAILAKLVGNSGRVVTTELDPSFAKSAKRRLERVGVNNADVVQADGVYHFTAHKAFDRILVTASLVPSIHLPLYFSLREGGICVAPFGGDDGEPGNCLLAVMKKEEGEMRVDAVVRGFSFVLAEGMMGWSRYEAAMRHLRLSTFIGDAREIDLYQR